MKKKIVVILGPTGVGKTKVAIKLASRFMGEIISADSRLFYKGMDIGTDKPTAIEKEEIPHHLIDVSEPDETWTLGRYIKAVDEIIDQIFNRGKLPFLVGGTGQYIRGVVQGWIPPEIPPNKELRKVFTKITNTKGERELFRILEVLDPKSAKTIDFRNTRRVVRALEVIFSTGKPFSSLQGKNKPHFESIQIGITIPREELYKRNDQRIERMVSKGLVNEVKSLIDAGFDSDLPGFSAIGYREIISHLKGEITLEEAITEVKRSTRILVRRQANWFNISDPDIKWFAFNEQVVNDIGKYLEIRMN